MAKKKIIDKERKTEEEKAKEAPQEEALDEEVDAFDLEEVPEDQEEGMSDLEQELMGEEEFQEEIQEERFYTIPLAKKGFGQAPKWKAAKKAMIYVRKFLTQHMKPEGEVYISQDINERVWENGIKNPPRKIRIRVTKSIDGIVRAYLA